jgi:hypothetical protein
MDTSVILAQILGIVFVVMGLSMLCNKKGLAKVIEDMLLNKGLMWLAGFMALAMGAIMIAFNNIWTSGLPLFITILGWLALIKGILILVFPGFSISFYRKMNKGNIFVWAGVIVFILGLV